MQQQSVLEASPYEKALGEAEDQHLGKESKVNTLLQAVFVDQIDGIAQDELDTVARYRAKKLFGATDEQVRPKFDTENAEANDVAGRSITICDNYSITHPQPPAPIQPALPVQQTNPVLPWILATALGAGGLGAGIAALWKYKSEAKPSNPPTNSSTLQGVGSTTELVQPK